jgi:hypothetical protein
VHKERGKGVRADVTVFVTSDVVCILVQLAGGALFGTSAGKEPGEGGISVDTATNVLMAGLVLQVTLLSFSHLLPSPRFCLFSYTKHGAIRFFLTPW